LELEFYFSNLQNEIINVTGFEPEEGFKLTGSVYGMYIAKQNYFVRFDMQGFYARSKVTYENSVDALTYISAFEEEKLGYNSMLFTYWFLSNTVDVGYVFMPAKLVRPYVFAGVGVLALLSLDPSETYQQGRNLRNSYIENEVSSFKNLSVKFNTGIGLKYHSLSLETYVSSNLGAIDRFNEIPLYQSYSMVGATVRLDLFTFNLVSKEAKKKVNELLQYN